MDIGVDTLALLLLVAFVAGFVDAIAGGGGLLTLPSLLAAGLPPVAAIATNKLQSSFGTVSAVIAFHSKGHIDWRAFAVPVVASLIGSALGAVALMGLNPSFLEAVIPLLLVAMALYFLFGPRLTEDDRHARIGRPALIGLIAVIGGYDGFFGPGTGSFFILLLVAFAGLGIVRAIAHTKLLNAASNVGALVTMIAGGHVVWTVGLVMAVGSVAGAQLGSHTAMRFGSGVVRPLLVIGSLALTARLVSEADNPLRLWIMNAAGL